MNAKNVNATKNVVHQRMEYARDIQEQCFADDVYLHPACAFWSTEAVTEYFDSGGKATAHDIAREDECYVRASSTSTAVGVTDAQYTASGAIPVAWFFRKAPLVYSLLNAMQAVVSAYPRLSGFAGARFSTRIETRTMDELTTALREVRKSGSDTMALGERVLIDLPHWRRLARCDPTEPRMTIRLTRFSCGGACVSVAISHAIADTRTLVNVAHDMASVMCGGQVPERSSVFCPAVSDEHSNKAAQPSDIELVRDLDSAVLRAQRTWFSGEHPHSLVYRLTRRHAPRVKARHTDLLDK